MKIDEAMSAVSSEYDAEIDQANISGVFERLMAQAMHSEYEELDHVLPEYVADIARAHGLPVGTILPPYVYQIARMCFRMGMRTQRKLDHPSERTTTFWRGDGKPPVN